MSLAAARVAGHQRPIAKRDRAMKKTRAAMTAEQAVAAAEAEGLVLMSTHKGTGFKGVTINPSPKSPFKAVPRINGHMYYLGSFATAEEASLAIARLHATIDRM